MMQKIKGIWIEPADISSISIRWIVGPSAALYPSLQINLKGVVEKLDYETVSEAENAQRDIAELANIFKRGNK